MNNIKRQYKKTSHCERRMAQRAIPDTLLDLLLMHGEGRSQKGGAELIHLDEKAVQKTIKAMKQLTKLLTNDRPCYAVVGSDGCVITVGHSYKKHRVIH
jgi:hypothetical protein